MTSKINKMSSQLPLTFYAGLRITDIQGPWHYKGYELFPEHGCVAWAVRQVN